MSVRFNEFRTFTESAKRLQMNYRAFPTGYHLLISILEVRIDFDADLVEALAKNIAALSKEISLSDSVDKQMLTRISHLQENTMLIRETSSTASASCPASCAANASRTTFIRSCN